MFSSFFVSVHSSLLYKNILATYALKVLSLILMEFFLLLKMLLSVLVASIANIFLLLMSFSVSSRLPRIFHCFLAIISLKRRVNELACL